MIRSLVFMMLTATCSLGQGLGVDDHAFMGQSFGAPLTFKALGTNNTTSAASSYNCLAAYQVDANAVALAFVMNSKASAPDTNTWSGNGLTWTRLATTNYNVNTARITVYYSTPSNNISASATGTADFAGNSQTGCGIYVCEFMNCDTANPIVQHVRATNANANASATLGSYGSAANAAIAFFGNVVGNSGNWASPEAGWTEDLDEGYNTPASGHYVQHQMNASDTSSTVTSSAAQWACIAVEIKAK